MRTARTRQLALVLSATALAVGGCGGSSKKHSPTTPASGTGTSGSTTGSSILSLSTPVNSSTYRTALASRLAQIAALPSADIPKIVDCAVQKLESQGITTVGDVDLHSSEAKADGQECARALGLH